MRLTASKELSPVQKKGAAKKSERMGDFANSSNFFFFLFPLSPGLAWRIGQPGVSYVPEMNLFSLSISWRPFLFLLLHREICWQSSSPPTQSRFPISMRPSEQSIRQSVHLPPEKKMHRIYGRVWGTVRKCDATGAYFSPGPQNFLYGPGRPRVEITIPRPVFFSFFHVRSFILPFSLWLLLLFLPRRLCAKSE